VKVAALVLYRPPKSLSSFRLSEKIVKKRCHSTQNQEDAHQIIEDFRKNHYEYTEDKGDDSSNQTQFK
jgi:hypothetical protein